MLVYLGLGVIWAWWLEYYTTTHLEGILDSEWTYGERILHIALWPAMLLFFIYNIFRHR